MSPRGDRRRGLVALIEVDRFDGLRRTIGYAAATRVLTSLAERIETQPWGGLTATLQRSLIEVHAEVESTDAARARLAELARDLAGRIDVDGFGFDVAVRIGAADCGADTLCEDHIGLAERALATTRRGGGRVVVLHGPAGGTVDRLSLMRRLQRALADDALSLHYQPKLEARTGMVAGVEALLRWQCPIGGNIPPDQFISIAEETGDIRAVTEWVVDRAVADRRRFASAGYPELRIEINMSGGLLDDAAFIDRMIEHVAPSGGMVGFEITETTTVTDRPDVLENLRRCSVAGVRLAIDDYGAGVSSLAYLQQLPVDELKIDRSFISRLTSQQRDPLLVRSTIDLAHALDMEVTAEGVDSPHAMALLQVMGCDLLQGFYLSKPLPFGQLLAYLEDGAARTALVQSPRLGRRIKATER